MSLKAVLFDLDDTLSDHQHSRRCGLRALQAAYPTLSPIPLVELEREHEMLLMADYGQVLDARLSIAEARRERIRLLLAGYGVHLSPVEVETATGCYRQAYEDNRRAVPGARELLQGLSGRVKTGVVTNGLGSVQRATLEICGLDGLLSFVLISEEVGIRKPDPRIYEEALRRAGARPPEAVFIGDSWPMDVLGPCRCGIRPIWLNRYGLACPDPHLAPVVTALTPIEDLVGLLFGSDG